MRTYFDHEKPELIERFDLSFPSASLVGEEFEEDAIEGENEK
jgi:hypothetical protein